MGGPRERSGEALGGALALAEVDPFNSPLRGGELTTEGGRGSGRDRGNGPPRGTATESCGDRGGGEGTRGCTSQALASTLHVNPMAPVSKPVGHRLMWLTIVVTISDIDVDLKKYCTVLYL